MKENKKMNLYWVYFYMLLITIVISLLPLLYYQMAAPVMLILLIITLITMIAIWNKLKSKRMFFLLDILNIMAVISFSSVMILLLKDTIESIVSFIIVVVCADVFSFTKRGNHTINAKLMANTSTLTRLSICLPIPGLPGLQPIIGIGDLYFYSVMTLFTINVYSAVSCYIVLLILVIGQIANILLISLLIHKVWFKGFPATLFPGLFYLLSLVLGIIK